VPELRLLPRVGLELECPVQQGQALLEPVAADSQLRRAPRPGHRLLAERLDLVLSVQPREIDVLRPDRFGVVVREHRRVLVVTVADAL
jgi:hypothetical protein